MTTKAPAHPIPGYREQPPVRGMSLLDHFAGEILGGMAAPLVQVMLEGKDTPSQEAMEQLIAFSYDLAEGMMVERKKRGIR